MTEKRKRAADLAPGDQVILTPYSHGQIVSCRPSHSSPIKCRATGMAGVALIIVFKALDGPFAGLVEADFRHPEDHILCR